MANIEKSPEWRNKDLRNLTVSEVIQYCNAATMRGKESVLGYAQVECEDAYNEFFGTRNPRKTLTDYFFNLYPEELPQDGQVGSQQLKALFRLRQRQLEKLIKSKKKE